MHRTFLDGAGKAALSAAAQAIEGRSSAEVVVMVRPHSGSYRHADLLLGTLFAWATLWFQLFSPWDFSLESIFVAPVVAAVVTATISSRSPLARRLLTRAEERRSAVLIAARAAFVEKGVGLTIGRTGILVFLSLLERIAVVVADKGVRDRVATEAWGAATASIDETFRKGGDGKAVAERILALGDLLAPVLPRAADDVDELAEEVMS